MSEYAPVFIVDAIEPDNESVIIHVGSTPEKALAFAIANYKDYCERPGSQLNITKEEVDNPAVIIHHAFIAKVFYDGRVMVSDDYPELKEHERNAVLHS